MTDIKFNRHLDALSKAHTSYRKHLAVCELEYERRYGKSPSNADDDTWIDTFHVIGGTLTAQEVEEGAITYAGLRREAV